MLRSEEQNIGHEKTMQPIDSSCSRTWTSRWGSELAENEKLDTEVPSRLQNAITVLRSEEQSLGHEKSHMMKITEN